MSFWRGVAIFGAVVVIAYASLVGVYFFLESRPRVIAEPSVAESPLEIMRASQSEVVPSRGRHSEAAAVQAMVARTFESALDAFGGGAEPTSFDHDEVMQAARAACNGFDPSLDPSEWFKSELMRGAEESGSSIRSLQLTVYFQNSYCNGIDVVTQDFSYDGFLEKVGFIVENSDDEDSLRFAEIVAPTWSDIPADLSDEDYSALRSLASTAESPSVYLDAVSILLEDPRGGLVGADAFARLDNSVEARQARIVAASLAQCQVFSVCPPMGLRVMSLCAPYDCPANGSIRAYYASKYSDDVIEVADDVVTALVSRREAHVE